jgi:hypothetical protein
MEGLWVLTASPDGPSSTDHAGGRSCNDHAYSIAGTALRVGTPIETGALESLRRSGINPHSPDDTPILGVCEAVSCIRFSV